MDGNAFKPLFDLFEALIPLAIIGVLAILGGGALLLYMAIAAGGFWAWAAYGVACAALGAVAIGPFSRRRANGR